MLGIIKNSRDKGVHQKMIFDYVRGGGRGVLPKMMNENEEVSVQAKIVSYSSSPLLSHI